MDARQPGFMSILRTTSASTAMKPNRLTSLLDFLLDECLAPIGYPLMNTCHDLALLLALLAPFGGFGELALGTS